MDLNLWFIRLSLGAAQFIHVADVLQMWSLSSGPVSPDCISLCQSVAVIIKHLMTCRPHRRAGTVPRLLHSAPVSSFQLFSCTFGLRAWSFTSLFCLKDVNARRITPLQQDITTLDLSPGWKWIQIAGFTHTFCRLYCTLKYLVLWEFKKTKKQDS